MAQIYSHEQIMAMSPEEKETLKQALLAEKARMSQAPQASPYAQARPTLGQSLGKALLMGTQAYTTGKVPTEAFEAKATEPDWYTKQQIEQEQKLALEKEKANIARQAEQDFIASMPEGEQYTQESVKVGDKTYKRVKPIEELAEEDFRKNELVRQKEQIKTTEKARRDFNAYTGDAMQSLVALDKLEKASEKLGDFGRGLLAQTGARIGLGVGRFGADKNTVEYFGVLNQELIPAARKIMEEKGPITEFDVKRVEEGLGNPSIPLEDKKFLLNQLRDKIRQAVNNKLEVAEISPEEFSGKYRTLAGKLGGASGQVEMRDPQGNVFMVDASEVEEALQNGWTR